MQQPQSRPLLGDSVSSTSSQTARRNNPVAVLTHQQLQQLQQLQAHNTSGHSLTFALQASNNTQEHSNGSTGGNHIVYVNQLNQLNQGTINPSGPGMGLPPATPTFGVGLNMGLPLSLLNTSLTSLTSNVITTSNPLLNLGLPSITTGLTAINPSLSNLNAINPNLNANISSTNINSGLSNLGQDLNSINTGINRVETLNSATINSGLSSVHTGLNSVNPNLTSLNSSINQNLTTLSTNFTAATSAVSALATLNPNVNTNLTTTSLNSNVNQGLNRSLTSELTSNSLSNTGAQFPFQTIQNIQNIAPQIVGSNITHVSNAATTQHSSTNISTIAQISNSGTLTTSAILVSKSNDTIHSTTTNTNHTSNVSQPGSIHSNLSGMPASSVQQVSTSNDSNLNHVSSLCSPQSTGFQQRQYSQQGINPALSSLVTLSVTTSPSNVVSTMNTVKSVQGIQNQNISSPGSPFSIPLKSPASNIAPPTPSPSPNRLLLRSPASNSIQSNRNSPSPVGTSSANNNFNIQMQSPMQSPISVSQIQSPVLSPYAPAKSPHLSCGNNSLSNRSPAPGGSPGPPVVRPNTPILQQGMQVLQIIHGTPQGYQPTPTQLVTRTHLFGNQQIQIAATKPTKQPPQILPKPPNQQTNVPQQKSQRTSTTITNQVSQQTQPQLVLAGPQPNPATATMIPTAQGLLLNQVLPSTGPVIVQQQPGGVQLILRTPASAQQQTHTAQLTQQQLVRVVTAQGMQLQGITPTFFAVPNGFPSAASPVIRHTPSSPAPSNAGSNNSIVIQNTMVQNAQPRIAQVSSGNTSANTSCTQTIVEQNLLPPPKKKAKKKKKAKRKEDEAPKLDLASIIRISGIGDDDDLFDSDLATESDIPCQVQVECSPVHNLGQLPSQVSIPSTSVQNFVQVPAPITTNTQASVTPAMNNQLVTQLQMPVQSTITGQLRLAIGEDGRVILHHTPEPNQPEIDQATAQALIRSLTQSGSQNLHLISHLLGQTQVVSQTPPNNLTQRSKSIKSPSLTTATTSANGCNANNNICSSSGSASSVATVSGSSSSNSNSSSSSSSSNSNSNSSSSNSNSNSSSITTSTSSSSNNSNNNSSANNNHSNANSSSGTTTTTNTCSSSSSSSSCSNSNVSISTSSASSISNRNSNSCIIGSSSSSNSTGSVSSCGINSNGNSNSNNNNTTGNSMNDGVGGGNSSGSGNSGNSGVSNSSSSNSDGNNSCSCNNDSICIGGCNNGTSSGNIISSSSGNNSIMSCSGHTVDCITANISCSSANDTNSTVCSGPNNDSCTNISNGNSHSNIGANSSSQTQTKSDNATCNTGLQEVQLSSTLTKSQKTLNISQDSNAVVPNVCVQSHLGSLQPLDTQIPKNMQIQNVLYQLPKSIQPASSNLVPSNTSILPGSDILSTKPLCTSYNIQSPRLSNMSQLNVSQASNISTQKSSQIRLTDVCINSNVRQHLSKQVQLGTSGQKLLTNNSNAQGEYVGKNNQNVQVSNQQEDCLQMPQPERQVYQHNPNPQIAAQAIQAQNIRHIFEHNLQTTTPNIQHNSVNVIQQQSSCNATQHSNIQQNTVNVLQQSTPNLVQGTEQGVQSSLSEISHAQPSVVTNLQQQNVSTAQNINVHNHKVLTTNAFSPANVHRNENEATVNVTQPDMQHNNQHPNIVITNVSNSNMTQQKDTPKNPEPQTAGVFNPATNSILNNAPKITPEILNALSNLNPNDQLLIANANGQMQVISQQLLQQFLAGQLNATNQAQNRNQTQKIVIGEPDANNQNVQGVQINTPTSQIIVNSSGGAPTIQNNIQNIVVQAAPSQIPHQIQIQNSGFPSQFIDSLNQQQIRTLGNNTQVKKTKIAKRAKVAVTIQNVGNVQQTAKTVTAARPTMVSTDTINLQKGDGLNKTVNIAPHATTPIKNESTQAVANGPLISSASGGHLSMVSSNGQMVQKVQTIQLPAQKQQLLKNIQSQIQAILARKSGSQPDQTVLTKLYQEQAKILASGKVVSTTTHSVNTGLDTNFNVNVVSAVTTNLHGQNSYKNQTSAVQTQTQTSTATLPITSQCLSTGPARTQTNSGATYLSNFTVPQNIQLQSCVSSTVNPNAQQVHAKQHKYYQNHGNQIISPSSSNNQIFSTPSTSTTLQPNNAQQSVQPAGTQHSTQCQTDPLDVKGNLQAPSPIKQELSSPIHVQVHVTSPAGQVASPRVINKGSQRIQSPVNNTGGSIKQLVSPGNNSSTLTCPRQGIKRPASSPICRQINRSDLLEQQLKIDQNGATNPDVNTPFLSKRDACKRLVRYHCLNEQVLSTKDLAKADEIFEETAKHLLTKFNSMMNKYTYLLLMESMREVRTSELMMIDRTFVAEEQSILNRLREQEAKVNEEFKKEDKPLVPKVEPGLMEDEKMIASMSTVSVKRELEDDFPSEETETKPIIKSTSCTSGDYDEWLEIQKELGVYPTVTDSFKYKNSHGNNSGNSGACAITIQRSSKTERTRTNGECRANVTNISVPGVSNVILKNSCDQDATSGFERHWTAATDLERDLLEDTDSLDGLALHSQSQCPNSLHISNERGMDNEHDDITAQVQSAIDSILNLKKRPANTLSGSNGSGSQSSESKDTVLDQAVRSILGS